MPTDLSFYIRAAAQLADRIIDETKLAITAAALNLERYGGIYWQTFFESTDGFEGIPSIGLIELTSGYIRVLTTPVTDEYAEIFKAPAYPIGDYSWDKNRRLKTKVAFVTDSAQTAYIITGDAMPADRRRVGFKVVDNKLYGCVSDGTDETLLELQTITAGDILLLECVFTAGTKAEFFVGGVSKGSITTGLPSGTTSAETMLDVRIITAEAAIKEIDISEWRFLQEP